MPAVAQKMASQKTAPIMPLASRSLLLDVSTAGDRIVVAGERGHILYSDDDGNTWTQASVPTTQMLTGLHFVDDRQGWAAGHDGLILASDDGGESWRLQRDGLAMQHQANLEMRESSHRRIKALEAELEATTDDKRAILEMQLDDARMDLEDADLALEEPVHTAPVLDIWFQDENRGWAVGAFGTLVSTRDGGQHWSSEHELLDNPYEFHLNSITGDGKGRIFIAGEGGLLFRSLDGGLSWESIEPFYEGSWFGVVYEPTHDSLAVFGLQGNLYHSSDFGSNWELVPNDSTITLAGGSAHDGKIVIAGGVGTVLLSTDGGRSYERIMIEDRLSLGSGMSRKGALVLIGQGGAKVRNAGG